MKNIISLLFDFVSPIIQVRLNIVIYLLVICNLWFCLLPVGFFLFLLIYVTCDLCIIDKLTHCFHRYCGYLSSFSHLFLTLFSPEVNLKILIVLSCIILFHYGFLICVLLVVCPEIVRQEMRELRTWLYCLFIYLFIYLFMQMARLLS